MVWRLKSLFKCRSSLTSRKHIQRQLALTFCNIIQNNTSESVKFFIIYEFNNNAINFLSSWLISELYDQTFHFFTSPYHRLKHEIAEWRWIENIPTRNSPCVKKQSSIICQAFFALFRLRYFCVWRITIFNVLSCGGNHLPLLSFWRSHSLIILKI